MIGQTVLLAGLALSTVLTVVVTVLVWRERPKTGATAMTVVLAGLALWGLGQVLVVGTSPRWLRSLGLGVTVAATALVSIPWLVFSLQYAGRGELVTRRRLALLAVEPVAIAVLALTNPLHGLVWTPTMATGTTRSLVDGWGPALVIHVTSAYVVTLVGNWFLLRKFLASRNVYRKRTFLFVLMSLSVVCTSALSFTGTSPLPYLTLTPVTFLGYGLLSLALVSGNRFISALPLEPLFGLFRSRSRNLAPVARDTAIEELATGFVVTDHENRIVDINPVGRRMLGQTGNRIVGKALTDVLPPSVFVDGEPAFLEPGVTGEFSGVWVHTSNGQTRCYDVTITDLSADDADTSGRVGLMHDVTDRERRKQQLERQNSELERQNEQLEQFANIVSHDIRNPLNVANGRLELVDAGDDQSHVDEARSALERIEDIIHDVLTLARLGKTVDDTEPVNIAAVASEAWDNVDAPDATLVVDIDDTVDASRSRLLQVFENLYRNAVEHGTTDNQNASRSGDAVERGSPTPDSRARRDADEHGGPAVTVTVESLPDGFYVADDGSGLPDDHLDDVLDEGFTTEDDGTGFGLSIVETIADAHGWSMTVTNGSDGGARFEFTGIDATRQQEAPPVAD